MKKKLLAIILSCALAFSATACSSSAGKNSADNVTKKENETKTPIEEAVESTKTIGEINREVAVTEGSVELAETPAETPEIVAEVSETSDASEDYVANYIEGITSDETTSIEPDITSAFQSSMNDSLLSSLTGDTSSASALTELPENFTFTLPEGFFETEEGMYMNSNESNPAYIGCFALANDGFSSDTSMVASDAEEAEVHAYFEALASEMETELYNTYGINVNVSLLESNFCQVNGNDGYTLAFQYDMSEYGVTMLQFVGLVNTPDYIYFLHCMEALGTNYYDDFKACFNSISIN